MMKTKMKLKLKNKSKRKSHWCDCDVVHNTAQNCSDNLSSYSQDECHC